MSCGWPLSPLVSHAGCDTDFAAVAGRYIPHNSNHRLAAAFHWSAYVLFSHGQPLTPISVWADLGWVGCCPLSRPPHIRYDYSHGRGTASMMLGKGVAA